MKNRLSLNHVKVILVISLSLVVIDKMNGQQKHFTQSEFSNDFILNNKVGMMYQFDAAENVNYRDILVRWNNGYYLLGQVRFVKQTAGEKLYPENFWYLYDRKGRLREILNFSGFDCPIFHKVYRKNGQLKSESHSSPCI